MSTLNRVALYENCTWAGVTILRAQFEMNVSAHPATPSDELPMDGGQRHIRAIIERDVRVCTGMLDEAQGLLRMGQNGPVLAQFVHRARQILDELPELMVALSPVQDAALLERIANLNGMIESVRLSMHRAKRDREVDPSASG
jgi:hypothetical protein